MINLWALLGYLHASKNNPINYKSPRAPPLLYICTRNSFPNCHNQIPIRTYISHMLAWFSIRIHFLASLSIRLSNSVNPVIQAKELLHKKTMIISTPTLLHTQTPSMSQHKQKMPQLKNKKNFTRYTRTPATSWKKPSALGRKPK